MTAPNVVPFEKPEPKPRTRFTVKWFRDIDPHPIKEQLIAGFLGVGEFSAVVGLPGSGKSAVVADAACHVAAGRTWHGRKVKQGLVVYFAGERVDLIYRRMAAIRQKHGMGDIQLVVVSGRLDLTSGLGDVRLLLEEINDIEKACGATCVWIVFDTPSRTFGPGDQNQTKDMAKYVQSIDEFRYRTSAHVTVIHHCPHTAKRGKGAIDLDGAVDASFFVNKSSNGFLLECDGQNDGAEGEVLRFNLEPVVLSVDVDGLPTTAPVVVAATGNLAGRVQDVEPAQGPKLTTIEATVLSALKTAIADHGEMPPAGAPVPEGGQVVTLATWRAAYYAADLDADKNTLKARFGRATKALEKKGMAGRQGDMAWVHSGTAT
jgi:hypothetical protein